jgi:hypothetical protein
MMHTLATARDAVRRFLDDNGTNQRYATAAIDQSLQDAISSCVSDYVIEGGDAFDVEVSVTTVAGVATLTGPLVCVRGVQISSGNTRQNVVAMQRSDRTLVDASVRTLLVDCVKDFVLPTNTAHPFIGDGVTGANSWHAFELWCFAHAALALGITDNDKRPGLMALEERQRRTALRHKNTPSSRPLPDRDDPSWFPALGYVYNANLSAPTLQLCSRDGSWQ